MKPFNPAVITTALNSKNRNKKPKKTAKLHQKLLILGTQTSEIPPAQGSKSVMNLLQPSLGDQTFRKIPTKAKIHT